MKSSGTDKFWRLYAALPRLAQQQARKQYALWSKDPWHPSLQFKPIGVLWSARVSQDYRALALKEGDEYHWIWIGTHAEYDQILRRK